MNCRTGDITNDPELIAEWKHAGDRVIYLPDEEPPQVAKHESELLHTLGVQIRDRNAETERRTLAKARAFVQRVNARR